jgi:hypothetical protein
LSAAISSNRLKFGKVSAKRAMPNGENMFLDELTRLSDAATQGECYVEQSTNNGAEVWQQYTPTGSMLIAKCGHAGYDKQNAKLIALLANRRREIIELVKAVELQNRQWHSPLVTEALNALDKEG